MTEDQVYPQNAPTMFLSFAAAMYHLNSGQMIQREGWNGKGQFIWKVVGNTVPKENIQKMVSLPQSVKNFMETTGEDIVFNSSITLYNAQGEMQPGWLPSQGDLFANDWQVVN